MFKIIQRFDLSLEDFTELSEEEKSKYNYNARSELTNELWDRGYMVFECGSTTGGIPHSILVLGESGHIKEDFYGIASKLGLSYRSGDFYLPMLPTTRGENCSDPKEYLVEQRKSIQQTVHPSNPENKE